MKPPKFRIGQAVVMCAPLEAPGLPEESRPSFGPVYHVRDVMYNDYHDAYGIRLKEIINPALRRSRSGEVCEVMFYEGRFAPVEELPADALEALLEETLSPVTV